MEPFELQHYRTIIDLLPDPVLLSDLDGRVRYTNTAACTLLGYSRETLHGLTMHEIDTRNWGDLLQASPVSRTGPPEEKIVSESVYRTADGRPVAVELSVSRITLDTKPYILTVARDAATSGLVSQHQRFIGRSIENSLTEIFMISEATLQFIYVNRGARMNTLYSSEELRSMRFKDVCREIDEDAFYTLTSSLKPDEKDIITLEAAFTKKNGEKYPVLLSIYKSKYISFNVFIIQAVDISEKVRQKARIKEAYDILDKSRSIAFVWQNEDSLPVSFVSGNLADTFGYDPEDFLVRKLHYADIVHPDDLPRVLDDLRNGDTDAPRNLIDHEPYRIVTADKQERWVKASSYVQRDRRGKTTHFQGIVEDITSLKLHQDELYKSNTLLEKTFQSISDIVLLLDPQFRIIMINRAGRNLLDRPNDEIIGSYCQDFFPENEYVCGLSQKALHSQSLLSEEVYLEQYNKYFIVSYAPIFDEEGRVKYIVNVMRDITERKLMEEQLFLSEKMTTIASLAAGVAHEINTPLSGILQSIQIIQMGFDMNRPENRDLARKLHLQPDRLVDYLKGLELDYFLDGMKQSAVNASKIITNLLNFSRPRKGEIRDASINELIENSLELARADYDLKKKYDIINVTINREYGENLPLVPCIAMEIEQVFLNLIKNSVHALAATPDNPAITIRTFVEHDYLVIHFEDTGPGIDRKILPKIFDPFFTTKEVGVGTGLGLSLSYSIIHDKHRGKIKVESEPGKGTTFIIALPLEKRISDQPDA